MKKKEQKNNEDRLTKLLEDLKNENIGITANAIWELGELKDEKAVDHLIPLRKHQNRTIREEALLALRKITGKRYR